MTLAIIPCLVVTVGAYRYALPQVNLEELVCLYDDDVYTKIECAGNQEVYRLRSHLLPMVRLNEVLDRREPFSDATRGNITQSHRQRQEATDGPPPKSLTFAVVKVGSQRFGLIVDRVLGTEEIVVKPMHPAMKALNIDSYDEDGVLGTAIVGDHMTLFLDVYRLIELAEPDWFDQRRRASPPPKQQNRVLLVEDTLFFRRLVKGTAR